MQMLVTNICAKPVVITGADLWNVYFRMVFIGHPDTLHPAQGGHLVQGGEVLGLYICWRVKHMARGAACQVHCGEELSFSSE